MNLMIIQLWWCYEKQEKETLRGEITILRPAVFIWTLYSLFRQSLQYSCHCSQLANPAFEDGMERQAICCACKKKIPYDEWKDSLYSSLKTY